ncbi:MAG: serine/threonine protein kinase, partial [Gammaproteobacteria bacterium]|nr:serine/threonine protein kinase [Gammaproteobacteria bacterium]
LASIHHTNIITIHDIGISNGFHFISMEYVEGGDLRERLREEITHELATEYIETIAGCLSVAHEAFIVHRDIKPANILFRKDGTLLLTDFGIAKQLTANKDLTIAGSMVGSPYYLSPEQAQGRLVDGRADIYSLGVLYFEMLTGKRPFSGDSDVNIAIKHITEPLPELPEALAAYKGIIGCMAQKGLEDRFPSCKSLLRALGELRATGQWSGEIAPIPLPKVQEASQPSEARRSPGSPVVEAPAAEQLSAKGGETVVLEETVADAGDTSAVLAGVDPDAVTVEDAAVIQPVGTAFESKRKTLQWIGGGIAVLVAVAVVAGLFLTRDSDTDTGKDQPVAEEQKTLSFAERERQRMARQAKIDGLLQQAESAIEQYQLTTPEEDNAFTYYQEVLSLDPNNNAAQQ